MGISLIRKLESAAQKEDWETVDKALPRAVKNVVVVQAALSRWIDSSNVHVLDLAGSCLRLARLAPDLYAQVREKCFMRMQKNAGNYAGFRFACAIAEHGAEGYTPVVKRVLTRFSKDDDLEVATLARSYLDKLGN